MSPAVRSAPVRGFVGGPLLLIVLGIAALLALRYLPVQEWLFEVSDGPDGTTDQVSGSVVVTRSAAEVTPQPAPVQPQESGQPKKPAVMASSVQVTVERKRTVAPPPAKAESSPAASSAGPTPNLKVFVQAEVHDRGGLEAYKAEEFSSLLRQDLEQLIASRLGPSALQTGGPNPAFREQFVGNPGQGRAMICERAGSRRVLLADVTIPSAGFSTVDSAYWPEVKFAAINCVDGRMHKRPKARLEPNVQDAFPFQRHFRERAESFVASQGYFLKP